MTQVWPHYLSELLGIPVLPMGVGAENIQQTQVRFNSWVAQNAAAVPLTGHICWCGHVNTNLRNQNEYTIVPVLQAMAARIPAGSLMPIGLTNEPAQPIGSAGYELIVEGVNVDLAAAFGNRYAEVRRYLVTDGWPWRVCRPLRRIGTTSPRMCHRSLGASPPGTQDT